MVYANQNHSRKFSTRIILKFCVSVYEKKIFPEPGWDQNNLPHMKTLVKLNGIYSHNVWTFVRLFNQNGLQIT